MESFTTFDIVKRLGIKRERLKDWIGRGFIRPSIQKAKGVGTKSLFDRMDLYFIKLFEFLVKAGLSREVASKQAMTLNRLRHLHKSRINNFSGIEFIAFNMGERIVEDGKKGFGNNIRLLTVKEGRKIILELEDDYDVASSYDAILIVNFAKLRKKVDVKLL
jgi:hypothetical protein